jgi:mediator of RNA polymerase II transcription subunit 13
MEPGDYLTNVLSFVSKIAGLKGPGLTILQNNYVSVGYEYFEVERLSSGIAKRHLQRLELGWRQEGKLVHYDTFREGLWVFHSSPNASTSSPMKDIESASSSVEVRAVGLVQRDKGTYEPASLVRSKSTIPNTMSTPSSSSSPSSSLENSLRNAQTLNARSIQTNSALGMPHEPGTLSPGVKSAVSSELSASLKDIHEYFISAVLSSLVYFLCRHQNYIPLNSRTLILAAPTPTDALNATYRSSQIMTPIELATLDISLTSLGALVVKAHSDFAPGLQSLADWSTPANNDELNVGASLWLAPSGNAAKFHSTLDESTVGGPLSMLQFQSNTTDLPSNALNTSTIKSWQSKCLDWLSAKGLNAALLDSGGWLYVQIIGGSPYLNPENQNTLTSEELAIVPWPALLCFQASGTTSRDLQQLGVAGTVSRDPLAFAEDWFNSRDERANSMLKRQKDRQAAEAVSREQADSDARALQSHIFSPATLRRGSNAGAMYPTPPDAPHPVGATPNFDGNVSTPGNQTSFAPPDSGSAPITTNTGVTDVDVDMWTSAKKERNGSAVQFTDNGAETDHLYGDSLDADMFGTDIIEADFDFFDVPDSVPHEDRVSTPTTPNLPIAVQTTHGQNPPESNAYGDTDIVEPEEDNYRELMHEPTTIIPVEELVDDPMELGTATQKDVNAECSNSQVQTSRERSPFTKETVFHRLSQRYNSGKCGPQSRRSSLFNKITFEDSVISVNAKYAAHGQFNFSIQKKKPALEWPIELPQTSYLRGRRKARDSKQISGFTPHIVVEKAPVDRISTEPMDYLIDSDAASQVSEQDDTSHTTDEPSPNSKLGVKRRWDADDGDDINSSFDALAMDLEHAVGTPQSISGSQLPMLDADPADWSLATYFTSPEPDVQSYLLSDPERIATAQILADQAVSGVFYTPGSMVSDNDSKRERVSTTRELMHCLARAAKSCLKDFNVCTMRSFLDIQGIPVLNQGLRLPPRPVAPRGPNGLEPARPNNPFLLPPPQLEVRRSDTKLTILPPAVNFWENLGLGPAQGVKDINAVCVYPNIDGAAINAGIFLDQMRSVYESSRFGNHNRASSKEVALGLLSYSLDPLQQHRQQYATALKETTAQLCRILQSLTVGETNFVVYFVYPNENGPLLVQICSAFQHLFYLYKKALSERRINMVNELVLQLIPLEFITSPTTLSMPLPSDYFHLSMEVYDRCIDFTSSSSSPAIMLERPLPKNIDFKLSSNPSASVLQENTCLHVAYAQSIDDRWVTAAWTDNRGTQQMTASYCLGRKNEPLSMPFSQIASEIWETTIDYVAGKKIHWRLMVAKVGVMEPSELEVWTGLASNETRAQVSLTLITVHTDPSLRLLPAATVLTPTGAATSSVITPVSTPQALQSSIVSPETANTPTRENANAVTAAEAPVEPDGDSRLVDLTDQSWGAVLGHRLNNSNSLLELNLALISGYLVKRGGMNSDDAPIVMEVNIVHSDVIGNPRTFHESLLREVLNYYRGLGSLARVRGVVDSVVDLRPWHIAAAEKAVKALYMLM